MIRSFLYVSQGSRAVTGLDPASISADANAFLDLTNAADRVNLLATLDDSATRLTTWNWAGRLQPTHEATEKWITIRAKPRLSDEGTTLWDGVVFDDTQSRLAQLELERSRGRTRRCPVTCKPYARRRRRESRARCTTSSARR